MQKKLFLERDHPQVDYEVEICITLRNRERTIELF